MEEDIAKIKLKKLIDDFKINYQKYKNYSEADIETKLVEELFINILGWNKYDFEKRSKTRRGERRGEADYAFKIDERIVFYLEVKRVGVPLDKEADKQVISYALSKRIPFAVSTNFEELKIFCVESGEKEKTLFRIFNNPDDYLNNFQDLLYLSKESFEKNIILKKAMGEDRLKKRISIDKALLEDLMHIRSLIANDIEKIYPKEYNINEKDDIIQRVIDRLIFIRKCEDTNMNPDNLALQEIKSLPDNKAYPKLKEIFKKYQEVYDSGLFEIAKDNDCDSININGLIIKKLTYYLYESKDNNFIYNFDWIDTDVLGQVYEQYLGRLLAQTKSGRAKLKDGQAHRKEQGIYYTPTYIVDYIVKNTVGEILKKKKTKVKDLKILDPACGSGSFLIKAFDYLYKSMAEKEDIKQQKIDTQGTYSIKTEILKNNLFGVDLDNKAVEITKLNLLLKAAEKNRKLPDEVDRHIKQGNSLIDDEEIAGLNAFKWEGEFEEGSFDVVIGNPPWSSKISKEENKSLAKKIGWSEKNINLCSLFVEESLKRLDNGGVFGFLLPKVFIKNVIYLPIRKNILEDYHIKNIMDFGQFPGVASDAIALIIQKSKSKDKTKISFFEGMISINENFVDEKIFQKNPSFVFSLSITPETQKIIEKIEKDSKELNSIFQIKRGIELGQKSGIVKCDKCQNYNEADFKYYSSSEKRCKKCGAKLNLDNKFIISSLTKKGIYDTKCISGTQISKYSINNYYFIPKNLKGISYKEDAFKGNKLLLKRISTKIEGTFSDENLLAFNTVYSVYNENLPIEEFIYTLGILNSKLMHFYYEYSYNIGMNLTTQVTIDFLSKVPLKEANTKGKEIIVYLVKKIILLNDNLNKIGDKKTNERVKIEEEIKKIDNQIDEEVYNLYGITKEEKKIIEESLK